MSKDRELLQEARKELMWLRAHSSRPPSDATRLLLARIDARLAGPQGDAGRQVNHDEVICPKRVHQFRAILQNVQEELAALRSAQAGRVVCGPWVPSTIHAGETYCKRCLVRSSFLGIYQCQLKADMLAASQKEPT